MSSSRSENPAPAGLRVTGLVKEFGGLRAVDIDALAVPSTGVTALIGPNGAGKTTAFDLVSGFVKPTAGTVYRDGTDITGWSPQRRAVAGLVRTFQLTRVFERLTVLENMLVGTLPDGHMGLVPSMLRPSASRRATAADTERAMALLADVRIEHMAGALARELSGGQKKLLEYSRALMSEPSMLLLDEPLAGVTPPVRDEIVRHVRAFAGRPGHAVLLIEHDLPRVMELADRVVVLDRGRVLAEGPPDVVTRNEAVLRAYLGRGDHG
ncbi:ABC transporter ATP-binding protein [Micromonospora sp. NPDC005113]